MPRAAPYAIAACALIAGLAGCDAPFACAVLDNPNPPASGLVVYHAFWQVPLAEPPTPSSQSLPRCTCDPSVKPCLSPPVPPGTSSDPHAIVPSSGTTAYVVLAPGWDPTSATLPSSYVVMQSKDPLAVHLNQTLHVSVDDMTFDGNCATGSVLTQTQADFITQRVFAADFAAQGLHYDAATCTTTGGP